MPITPSVLISMVTIVFAMSNTLPTLIAMRFILDSLRFFIDLIGNEADADESLYPSFRKMEYRAHLKTALADSECTLYYPETVILVDNVLGVEVGVGDIALQTVPFLVFGNPLAADGDLHILAYLKKLVVATLVNFVLGEFPLS